MANGKWQIKTVTPPALPFAICHLRFAMCSSEGGAYLEPRWKEEPFLAVWAASAIRLTTRAAAGTTKAITEQTKVITEQTKVIEEKTHSMEEQTKVIE